MFEKDITLFTFYFAELTMLLWAKLIFLF